MAVTALSRRDRPLVNHTIQVKLVNHLRSIINAILWQTGQTAARRFGFSSAGPNRYVPESPTGRPVPLAAFTKVSRLVNVVVVEVTKFSLHALASWAWYDLFWPLHLNRWISTFLGFLFYLPVILQSDCCPKQLNSRHIFAVPTLSHV